MKTLLAAGVICAGIALAPTVASAQHRVGDGLMGAAAGAVVGGPVGAVAGGLIGYTAGPHIARGLGIHDHRYYHRRYGYDHYAYDRRR